MKVIIQYNESHKAIFCVALLLWLFHFYAILLFHLVLALSSFLGFPTVMWYSGVQCF